MMLVRHGGAVRSIISDRERSEAKPVSCYRCLVIAWSPGEVGALSVRH